MVHYLITNPNTTKNNDIGTVDILRLRINSGLRLFYCTTIINMKRNVMCMLYIQWIPLNVDTGYNGHPRYMRKMVWS